jgi:hypothetical protein
MEFKRTVGITDESFFTREGHKKWLKERKNKSWIVGTIIEQDYHGDTELNQTSLIESKRMS